MVLKTLYKTFLPLVLGAMLFFCTPTPADKSAPVKAAEERPVNTAQILFEEKCASCHGNDGTAGLAGAADLQKSRTAEVDAVIRNGRKAMPEFKSSLTENEILQLTEYVKSLRR